MGGLESEKNSTHAGRFLSRTLDARRDALDRVLGRFGARSDGVLALD